MPTVLRDAAPLTFSAVAGPEGEGLVPAPEVVATTAAPPVVVAATAAAVVVTGGSMPLMVKGEEYD